MGAWPEDDITMIERLAGIASMMCLLDKDLLPFRTSVLAVACLETVLDRLSLSQNFVPNFIVDSAKTIESIKSRVYQVIEAQNND